MNNAFCARLSLWFILLAGTAFFLPYYAIGQDQMPAPANLQAVLDQDEGEPTQIHLTWQYNTDLEGFQGFVIFQNGDTLNGNLTQSLSHTQTLYEEGTFIYQVQAMFEDSVFSEMSERKIISNFQGTHYDFGPGSGDPFSDTWTIFIEEAMLGEAFLCPGDEIAIFYGDKIVGAQKLIIEPSENSEGSVVVIAFSDLNDGPGYEPGEPFDFEFYDASTDQVYDVYDYELSAENTNAYIGDVFPEGDGEVSYLHIYFDISLPPPQITEILAEGHTVSLQWELNSSRDIIGYEVFRNSAKLNDEPLTETSYIDENVVSGNYSYQVKALYDEGSSYFSEPGQVTIDVVFFDPVPIEELYNPMELQIQQAEVMGTPLNIFDEIGVFKITESQETCLAAKSLVQDFSASVTFMLPAQNPETGEPGFEEGDSLYFRFYDYDQEWEFRDVLLTFPESEQDTTGRFMPNGEANILLDWLPYPPENLELEVIGYDVHLTWNENTQNQTYNYDLDGYNVFRNQTQINEDILTSPEFVDSNLIIDDYSYYIQAVYDGVSSRPSNTVNTSIADQYFFPVQEETAEGNMQFNITQSFIDGEPLINYDQVGVFAKSGDSLICVGAGSIRDSATLDAPLTFTAYKDNPNTTIKDGFGGNGVDSIYYKFWDESTNNVYQYLDVSFPYGDELGYNLTHFYADTSCHVNLNYTSPLPIQFSLLAEEAYCVNENGQIAITSHNFRNINGLDFLIQTDTTAYSIDTVIAHQSFLENSETDLNRDTLTVQWESNTAFTLDNPDTLYIIKIQANTNNNSSIEWFEESSFSGMNYQTATYFGETFYIETLPLSPNYINGDDQLCSGTIFSFYSINEIPNAQNYIWEMDSAAGSIEPSGIEATVLWNTDFDGQTIISVAGQNECGTGFFAEKNVEVVDAVYTSISINTNTTEGCENDTIQFVAQGINGGNNPVYNWYINNEMHFSHNTTLISDDFTDEDQVYCELISSSECVQNNPAQSETITLDLNPVPAKPHPVTGPEQICNTVEISYYMTPGAQNADNYLWNVYPSYMGEVMANGNNAEVQWNTDTSGTAFIEVRGLNDCGIGPARQFITVRDYCTEIDEPGSPSLTIFPNPFRNRITISLPTLKTGAAFTLSDLKGNRLLQEPLESSRQEVSLQQLPRGMYILKIINGEEVSYRKVVKK